MLKKYNDTSDVVHNNITVSQDHSCTVENKGYGEIVLSILMLLMVVLFFGWVILGIVSMFQEDSIKPVIPEREMNIHNNTMNYLSEHMTINIKTKIVTVESAWWNILTDLDKRMVMMTCAFEMYAKTGYDGCVIVDQDSKKKVAYCEFWFRNGYHY